MLEHIFALTKQGAKNLKKGILSSTLAGISLMLPMSILLMLLNELLKPVMGEDVSSINIGIYILLSLLLLCIIYIIHSIEYKNTYLAAYEESANRRISLAEKLRLLPLSFFGQHDLAELTTSMMGDCTEVEKTFAQAVPKMFGSLLSIILVIIGLFFMDWRLSLALFCVLPFAFFLILGSKRIQDTMGNKKLDARLTASDGIQEFLETIGQIRACNQTEHYLEGLNVKLNNTIKASLKMELTTGTIITSTYMILRLGFPIVVLSGANLLINGKITFFTYLIFLIAASRIYEPLSGVINQIGEIFNSQLQIKRMKEIQNTPSMTGSTTCNNHGYDIIFNNVSFSYDTQKSVLKNVSFTAKQGEITALVGPSGSGKSTIAKLATRFWDIDFGSILLGGIDISKIDPETLLKNFSMVFQDVVLFHDSIMENIRLGRRTATDQEVIQAAKQARCDEFICQLPSGYQTVIGENGSTLSGGERQRLSIARALLKDAPIILLDEATASLDVENETLIQSALSTLIKDKTVIVIAHRMRTIAGADKIVVLDEGHVVECGTPDELFQHNGLYRHLVELQRETSSWSLS